MLCFIFFFYLNLAISRGCRHINSLSLLYKCDARREENDRLAIDRSRNNRVALFEKLTLRGETIIQIFNVKITVALN